ncbi:uncharacterized protein LOC110852931 isoform X3 [Folsomia candida]|uniref:uncharacterized protein LOC110852931 isoform X3 n=1 Tax=Folsomia candida TaxID=158441 RepID=UPI000B8EEFC3|nr:uncharacterized protein LOC110852931 isoform X3 [Folsomia candida]
MSRRPFDASFSRRPGGNSVGGGAGLMGDYHARGGGGGYHHGGEDEVDFGVSRGSSGGRGPSLSSQFDRVPRDGARAKLQSRFDDGGDDGGGDAGGNGGGWRYRTPSPQRFRGEQDRGGDRAGGRGPSWSTRGSIDYMDGGRDYGGSSGGGGSIFDTMGSGFQQKQQIPQLFQQQQQPTGILRNSNDGVVLLQPAGGLMGLNTAGANPFGGLGVLGTGPVMLGNLPMAFGQQHQLLQQQQQLSNPFGAGIGGGGSSIYGAQTQQRFDHSRNLITASSNDGGRLRRDFNRNGGVGRRSDDRNNRSDSASSRNNDPQRKRNLVLRDPHPDEAGSNKRPRISMGNNNNNKKPGQVKRVDIGKKPANVGSSHRPVKKESNKEEEAEIIVKVEIEEEEDVVGEDGVITKVKVKKIVEKKVVKDKTEEKEKKTETEYDSIPGCVLVCKVCQKVMHDGQSFESHLSGRAHQLLMKMLEERFMKRVELLMNESKCAEDEIGIEMDRQRRAGAGKGAGGGRVEKHSGNYCKMCDCNYSQNWGQHKVSLGHRVLKEFLHPTCQFCKAHFMHRKDWVTHLVSPAHFKKIQELKAEQGSTPSLEAAESHFQDELFSIHIELNMEERVTNAITIQSRDGKEPLTEEMKEILKNDRGEIVLPDGEIPLPKEYSNELMVGADAVVAVNGNRCRVCRVYIPEDKSVDSHCSSREHFNQYVSFLKRVNRHREHREREKKEAEEKAKKDEERKIEREKRKAEEKAKQEALQKEKEGVVANGETTKTEDGIESDKIMEVDDAAAGVKKESDENAKLPAEDGDVVTDQKGEEEQAEVDHGEEDNLHAEDAEDDEDDVEEVVEGEDAFLGTGDDGTTEVDYEGGEEFDTSGEFPTIVGVTGGVEVPMDQHDVEDVPDDDDVVIEGEESSDSVQEIEPVIVVPTSKTPAIGARRGRRGAVRGTPATTPALKNVLPKVDTNMRGRSRPTATRGVPRTPVRRGR